MQFLSKERQEILVRYLIGIGMRPDMATRHASYPDDLRRLDGNLAFIVHCIQRHTQVIRRAASLGDEHLRNRHEEPLRANLMILCTYRSEIAARGWPADTLIHTAHTIGEVLAEVRAVRDQLGMLIAHRGAMQ
jgi:hypothetical protein